MSRVDNTVSRYSKQMRFHLYTAEGKKRTTVSLHTTLARLMAIALGQQPESIEAQSPDGSSSNLINIWIPAIRVVSRSATSCNPMRWS
jgi:hypothetical protein